MKFLKCKIHLQYITFKNSELKCKIVFKRFSSSSTSRKRDVVTESTGSPSQTLQNQREHITKRPNSINNNIEPIDDTNDSTRPTLPAETVLLQAIHTNRVLDMLASNDRARRRSLARARVRVAQEALRCLIGQVRLSAG